MNMKNTKLNHKDILAYFDLEKEPFNKEIQTDELMQLPTLTRAAEELSLLFETKGIGLLTGPSGCGKSSLVRQIARELNPGLYNTSYICHSSLKAGEFYQALAGGLGLPARGRRGTLFRQIKSYIVELNDQKRVHPVIFIDEAHALDGDMLKELRMLTNFEYDSKNACTILLCGQTELRQKLSINLYASLANSITYSVRLKPLSAEETASYIEGRINSLCGKTSLFTSNAMKLIHDFSGGILRIIGTVAWQAMIKTFLQKHTQVEKEHVQMVLER